MQSAATLVGRGKRLPQGQASKQACKFFASYNTFWFQQHSISSKIFTPTNSTDHVPHTSEQCESNESSTDVHIRHQ